MLGFQAVFRASRLICKMKVPQFSTFSKQNLIWSHEQITSALSRTLPVPGSGLSILNIREILEKCKQEVQAESQLLLNGKNCLEQISVLCRISSIDILGVTAPTRVASIIKLIGLRAV